MAGGPNWEDPNGHWSVWAAQIARRTEFISVDHKEKATCIYVWDHSCSLSRVWDFIPHNSKKAFHDSNSVYFELDLTPPTLSLSG
ncbi:hypothetical protein GDO86_007861 [Hymenochirus boettgeri]|uniref:Uncharacterized protein n=1 Tax=Hymenochirus boettgeri TaxID=247094 RepID=A0A8T2IZM8_9PIPI|nr:hypothetical protein GDO86_007861 [Hymenochirus boettgeri]